MYKLSLIKCPNSIIIIFVFSNLLVFQLKKKHSWHKGQEKKMAVITKRSHLDGQGCALNNKLLQGAQRLPTMKSRVPST